MLHSWLYVSRSCVPIGGMAETLGLIAGQARDRNTVLDVTGALLFTGTYFAQCIEGPAASIAMLKTSIFADPRHDSISTLCEGPTSMRSFDRWALFTALNRSRFVEQIINRASAGTPRQHAGIDGLTRLLLEFARSA